VNDVTPPSTMRSVSGAIWMNGIALLAHLAPGWAMRLLSTCVPFLGICGIHVAAPRLLELERSLCPECDVSGAARTDHARQEQTFELLLPGRLSAP
jgi:hypothetical protein